MEEEAAARYSKAPDYPEIARAALEEMVRQTGGHDEAGRDRAPPSASQSFEKCQSRREICVRDLRGQGLYQPDEPVHAPSPSGGLPGN